MQIVNQPYTSSGQKNHPYFGMRISKLGHQIDEVLSQKGKNSENVNKLRFMLEDYFLSAINDGEPVGQGFFGRVFTIDDKYVFKCKNGQFPDAENGAFSIKTNDAETQGFLTGLKTYFGGILMQFGDVKILRNVSSDGKHIPVGVPCKMLGKYSKNELEYYYNNIYLPTFANLPQRSFDRVAKDFAYLNKRSDAYYGYQFDTNNSNNIVIVGTTTLRIVDDINNVCEPNPNRLCGLLDMFLKKANTGMLAPKSAENRALRFELFKKLILAGEKYELPLTTGREYDNNVWNMVCDFGQSGEEVLYNLNKIRTVTKSIRERLEHVNTFLDKMKVSVDK